MPGRLAGKVAFITGAGSGIGLESSILFATEGAKVVLADINVGAGQAALQRLFTAVAYVPSTDPTTDNVPAIFVKVDVSKEEEIRDAIALGETKFGKVNVIFNNAGIMHPNDDNAMTTDEKVWDLTMQINVKGVWWGAKHGIPALRRAGGGSIINTASFVALLGAATPQLAYTASKGAVLAMTRELATIHARENIRVNALCPGPLRTPLLMDFLNTEEKKERRMVHVPMGRFGEAIEQAYSALFLASDESSYITGTDFMVDGGLTAAYVTPQGQTTSVSTFKNFSGL
ncbi:hypothetical protein BASA50_007017 [Batrachochytrium salamandrivorans]|uniref:Glucose 1-dehydrogenase n=1 Tax=Batrachochytrium salamandrivorans TaxID=1357716 RepID=A0ABQ8FBE0_9FUNG|nr:hypothetical protein BASA60_003674 [Batrachochytrium salamandrivorans]KAH6585170.1 hypothetical protein BASA61_007035 [Batrachochytrium salamandrivorans]KAH6593962.1 hypothetical protein BASA50_007017 [Batrachochytrium salamandrivorans]KAH9250477.1 hypothetical protein BASA81_011717 [Batrachochytrium salamandrivorans]KAH9270642.1 hypothetical protein BASA83_007250 [Batrachochytrium salamandrivorans]